MSTPNKTRGMHYVWRHYLNAWANRNHQIYCLRGGKSYAASTGESALQRDFYKPLPLGPSEINFLYQMISQCPPELKKIHLKTIDIFASISQLENIILALPNITLEQRNNISTMIHNHEESLHSRIETDAHQYLESIYKGDISFWKNEEHKFRFLSFLCFQYLRTKKIQDRYNGDFRPTPASKIRFNNIWGCMRHILPINMTASMLGEGDYELTLLTNSTNTSFITGDQPVINLIALRSKNMLEEKDTELFYPVSPSKAILVSRSINTTHGYQREISEEEVNAYNMQIFKSSHEVVFSNTNSLFDKFSA